nr:MLO-like protein 4 [Tanacetum cinerariifolium]
MDKSDYVALRLGFITTHKLPLSYNFHNYMVRSMEDEFYETVGITSMLHDNPNITYAWLLFLFSSHLHVYKIRIKYHL